MDVASPKCTDNTVDKPLLLATVTPPTNIYNTLAQNV